MMHMSYHIIIIESDQHTASIFLRRILRKNASLSALGNSTELQLCITFVSCHRLAAITSCGAYLADHLQHCCDEFEISDVEYGQLQVAVSKVAGTAF